MEAVGNERKGKWSRRGWGGEEVWGVEPQQTLLRQSAGSQPQGQAGRRGPDALLAALLYLIFTCSHLMGQNNVLGNFTHDSSGILSYTNTIPILTNYLRVIPTRETCRTAYMLSFIPLEGQTVTGFKLRKKFHS